MADVWTRVQKPSESSVLTQITDAEPWGFLLAITSIHSDTSSVSVLSGWGNVDKPTSSIWTLVSKPTS